MRELHTYLCFDVHLSCVCVRRQPVISEAKWCWWWLSFPCCFPRWPGLVCHIPRYRCVDENVGCVITSPFVVPVFCLHSLEFCTYMLIKPIIFNDYWRSYFLILPTLKLYHTCLNVLCYLPFESRYIHVHVYVFLN